MPAPSGAAASAAGLLAYTASQALATHAAWHANRVPTRSQTMFTFFYNLLPNEFAHVGVVVHGASLVWALRRLQHELQNRVTTTANLAARAWLLAIGMVLNAVTLWMHVRMAQQNMVERQHVLAALHRAGLDHALPGKLSWSEWAKLSLTFPGHYWLGTNVVVRRNVPYVEGPTAHRLNRLDVFYDGNLPAAEKARAPILFFIHGGGFIIGSKEAMPYTLVKLLVTRGWVVVSCNYRLAPRVALPEIVTDVKRALAWYKTVGAQRFAGDPGAVACAGESAGGHLALMVALTANDPSFQPGFESIDTSVFACLDIYGVHDLTDAGGHFAARDQGAFLTFISTRIIQVPYQGHEAVWARCSPLSYLADSKTVALAPPIMMVHGVYDNLVPIDDARTFYRALRKARHALPTENRSAAQALPDLYLELPSAHHCFNWIPSPRTLAFDAAALAFLTRAYSLGRPGPAATVTSAASV